MPTPEFILELREKIGNHPLWLSGITAVVVRRRDGTDTADRTERGDASAGPESDAGSDEVLIVRRTDNGAWTPVTGIIDPGEEPAVAAEREILEESDIVARTEWLAWVHVIEPHVYDNGDRAQYIDLVFRCSWISGEPFPADGENTDARWCRLDDLPPSMSDDMRERIAEATSDRTSTRFER